MNHKEISNNPSPTTTSPITAPLRNAILRPELSDFCAAFVVLADAYVAVFNPKNPERPEKNPPVRNAKGTHGFCTCSTYARIAKKIDNPIKIIETTLYCCLIYAIAPFLT